MPEPIQEPAVPIQWGAEALWEQLEPLLPGLSVEVVARSNSTNAALLERARVRGEPLDEPVQVRRSVESAAFGRRAADVQPCLLVAEHQTHGRGRMGRIWQSEPGASLTFSLSLRMNPPDWSGMSLAVGVALADALDPASTGGPQRIGLKWPNDLWLLDADDTATPPGRKLGGILIETVPAGTERLAVIGIGINVLPLTQEVKTGSASLQEFDAAITAPRALARLARPLVEALQLFDEQGFQAFAERFAARDLLRGRQVNTTLAGVPEGVACGVSAHGALRVQTDTGMHEVSTGDVSVRLQGPEPKDAPC